MIPYLRLLYSLAELDATPDPDDAAIFALEAEIEAEESVARAEALTQGVIRMLGGGVA